MDSRKVIAEYMLHQWADIIRQCKESGLTVKAFCEQSNISSSVYYYWHKKLRDTTFEQLAKSQDFVQFSKSQDMVIHAESVQVDIESRPVQANIVPQGFTEIRLQEASTQFSLTETAYKSEPANSALPTLSAVDMPTEISTKNTDQASLALASGQINIEAGGCKITVDASYPTERLTLLLRELMKS